MSDRRTFLKGAAATIAATTVTAQAQAADKPAAKAKPGAGAGLDHVIDRPGSDFMVDVLRSLGIDYVASNPASSFGTSRV